MQRCLYFITHLCWNQPGEGVKVPHRLLIPWASQSSVQALSNAYVAPHDQLTFQGDTVAISKMERKKKKSMLVATATLLSHSRHVFPSFL